MIAEEPVYNTNKIETSISVGKTIDSIIEYFAITSLYFKEHISKFQHKVLNEKELTQEFVNLLQRKTIDSSFLIGQEKEDLYHKSNGRVDFYFFWKELSATTESFFDVEAKILTDRFPFNRKKEYVIGEKKNGGMERFKLEKHGIGLNQCGLLGFVEKYSAEYWIDTINKWIIELSKNEGDWNKSETLKLKNSQNDSVYLTSLLNRTNSEQLQLHHFWIV